MALLPGYDLITNGAHTIVPTRRWSAPFELAWHPWGLACAFPREELPVASSPHIPTISTIQSRWALHCAVVLGCMANILSLVLVTRCNFLNSFWILRTTITLAGRTLQCFQDSLCRLANHWGIQPPCWCSPPSLRCVTLWGITAHGNVCGIHTYTSTCFIVLPWHICWQEIFELDKAASSLANCHSLYLWLGRPMHSRCRLCGNNNIYIHYALYTVH